MSTVSRIVYCLPLLIAFGTEVTLATHSFKLVLESHAKGEIFGVDVNPINVDEYCTVGDDGSLKIWSISLKKCLRRTNIEFSLRAVAWCPTGNEIILGIGGDPAKATKDGKQNSSYNILDEGIGPC